MRYCGQVAVTNTGRRVSSIAEMMTSSTLDKYRPYRFGYFLGCCPNWRSCLLLTNFAETFSAIQIWHCVCVRVCHVFVFSPFFGLTTNVVVAGGGPWGDETR